MVRLLIPVSLSMERWEKPRSKNSNICLIFCIFRGLFAISLGLIQAQLSNLFFLNIQWCSLPRNYWCTLCRNGSQKICLMNNQKVGIKDFWIYYIPIRLPNDESRNHSPYNQASSTAPPRI